MHLDHALAGTPILFGHHGADEAVARNLLIESLREEVLFGTLHPVLAIEFLRYGVAIIENLPLLVREVKIHYSSPASLCGIPLNSAARCDRTTGRPETKSAILTIVRISTSFQPEG